MEWDTDSDNHGRVDESSFESRRVERSGLGNRWTSCPTYTESD